ncbi:MAG: carbohydrate binding domain-containing protein, partial [Bacteroidales bacterium]|nr:carbohydrate binding domain-containing protein [Bacteroidales bacterium]
MMKSYTKIIISAIFSIALIIGLAQTNYAQNLLLNPGFESWAVNGSGGPPDDWSLSGSSMTGEQETTIVYSGSSSTKVTWTTTSTRYLQQLDIPVTVGMGYTFSFWVLDNDPGGRARIAVRWYDSSDDFISGYYGGYTSDSPDWQQLSSGSQEAPAGAVTAHAEIRIYDVSSGWTGSATVYVDEAIFEAPSSATIENAYAISNTELDLVYSLSMSSVNAADYSLTGSAAITFSTAVIDGSNDKLVHLSGASSNMAGDITVDNIADAANSSNYDFYAGIMPVAFTSTTNSGGTMDNTHSASFQTIVSANDNYNNVWMSDATGGYNGVLVYDNSFDALVAVGDEILVVAEKTVYNNLTELIDPLLVSTISTGNAPYGPTVINGSDIDSIIPADTDPGEKWEGQLVKIENFTVESYTDYDYMCSWSDGTTTFYFHVGDNVNYHLGDITMQVGQTYASITGVVDWYWSGPFYRINPRDQGDIETFEATARIVGSFQGWNTTDPDYVLNENANGVWELTKTLTAGDNEYKVIEGDDWNQPNYPGNNQHIILTGDEDVTWKVNITDDLVTHTIPVVVGNFISALGGNDWDPTDLTGEMEDPDGDDIFTLELFVPFGDWECKVTLNHNWDQSTGGNVPFSSNGINSTIFTYDMSTNYTEVSGPPPVYTTITFVIDDSQAQTFAGFFLKGSWTAEGFYDPGWGGGIEHAPFYDDGTHGDITPGDHIFATQYDLAVDFGSNTWEWGVNDQDHNWIDGNWQFTIPDVLPQTLTHVFPGLPDLVITEIMYNPP